MLAISLAGCSEAGEGASAGPQTAAPSPPASMTAGPAPTPVPASPPQSRADPAAGTGRIQAEQLEPAPPDYLLGIGDGGPTLVQLIDPLDEPEFYCIDVPGFGAGLNLAAALSAHTCKPGADDELFRSGIPLPGNLQMPAYRLCLEAAAAEAAASLFLKECSDSPLQKFSLDADASLQLADSNLCIAIASGVGEPTGGPSHLRRGLSLEECGAAPPQRRRWQLPGPTTSPAPQ